MVMKLSDGGNSWHAQTASPAAPVGSPYGSYGANTYSSIPATSYQPPADISGGPAVTGGTGFPNGGASGGGVSGGSDPSNGSSIPSTPPIHPFDPSMANGDGTFTSQVALYKQKLADFMNQVGNQIGTGNIEQRPVGPNGTVDPSGIQSTYGLRNMGPLGHFDGANGGHFIDNKALGGSMEGQFGTALSGLDQSRTTGLTNLAEDYAARGLGASGVFAGAHDLADKGYQNQFNNLNTSVTGQANDLVNQLESNRSSTNQSIAAARQDALSRLVANNQMLPQVPSGG